MHIRWLPDKLPDDVRMLEETRWQRTRTDGWKSFHSVKFWSTEIVVVSGSQVIAAAWTPDWFTGSVGTASWAFIVLVVSAIVVAVFFHFLAYLFAPQRQREEALEYIRKSRNNLSIEGTLRRLAELRAEGVKYRNNDIPTITNVQVARDWFTDWKARIHEHTNSLSESEAGVYGTIDVFPPSVQVAAQPDIQKVADMISAQTALVREFILRFRDHWLVMAPLVDTDAISGLDHPKSDEEHE